MKHLFLAIVVLFTTVTTVSANVTISSSSYQKVGRKWVAAAKVIPGTQVRYINTLSNKGANAASNLIVDNAIPKEMKYIANSAKCQGNCIITYSVDGGKNYASPKKLFVKKGSRKMRAQEEDYTNIRWVVSKLNGGTQQSVEYSALLR